MVMALVGVVACSNSSSTSTDRGAAGAGPECPTLSGPNNATVKVTNKTKSSIILNVPSSSWTCADWSGSYNPGSLDGREVKAGATATARLEYKGTMGDRYGGVTISGPFLLGFATPNVNGTGSTPVELGGDGGITIKRNDWFKGRVAGRVDWSAKTQLTGIAADGQRLTVAWNGNTSSFDVTLSN